MTKTAAACFAMFCLSLLAAARPGQDPITLDSAPPVVVATVPQAGDAAVDPAAAEIKVTFSKDMTGGSWSWSSCGDETYPQTTGKPRYLDDNRTCVLPVLLKGDHTYAIWLNSDKFTNFKDTSGNSAVPYLLVFKTKP